MTGRYLGLAGLWLDGKRTRRRCTIQDEVLGVARFTLASDSAWRPGSLVKADLPCPELSRLDYATLYHYDPNDTERDGLGHAPVLRPGMLCRLTFVRNTDKPTLVAVDPP